MEKTYWTSYGEKKGADMINRIIDDSDTNIRRQMEIVAINQREAMYQEDYKNAYEDAVKNNDFSLVQDVIDSTAAWKSEEERKILTEQAIDQFKIGVATENALRIGSTQGIAKAEESLEQSGLLKDAAREITGKVLNDVNNTIASAKSAANQTYDEVIKNGGTFRDAYNSAISTNSQNPDVISAIKAVADTKLVESNAGQFVKDLIGAKTVADYEKLLKEYEPGGPYTANYIGQEAQLKDNHDFIDGQLEEMKLAYIEERFYNEVNSATLAELKALEPKYKEGGTYEPDFEGRGESQKKKYDYIVNQISEMEKAAEPPKQSPSTSDAVYMDMLTRVVTGEYSGPVAHAYLANHLVDKLIRTGKSDNMYMLDSFFNDFSKGIEKVNPQWNDNVLTPVKSFLSSVQKETGLNEASREIVYHKIANGLIDMVTDVGIGTYTTEQWMEKGQNMARLAAGMVIDNLKYTNDGASTVKGLKGVGATGNLLKLYKDLEAHPELLYQTAKGEQVGIINRSTLDDIQGQAKEDVKSVLGVDPRNLQEGWENEGPYDIKPIPTIRVLHGEKQGLYKYQVNEKGTGLDLRMFNEKTGTWDVYRTGTAAQNRVEDKKTETLKGEQHGYSYLINNLVKRKDDRQFRNAIMTDYAIPDTAFYIEGYDPETLDRVTEIPKDIADSIQRTSTPQVWEEIQRSWTEKGIRISTRTTNNYRRGDRR
jgi:hypothetical protein